MVLGSLHSGSRGGWQARSESARLFPRAAVPRADSAGDTMFFSPNSARALRLLSCILAMLAAARSLPAQDSLDPGHDAGKSPTDLAAVEGDWTHDAPGVKHHVNLDELPAPFDDRCEMDAGVRPVSQEGRRCPIA